MKQLLMVFAAIMTSVSSSAQTRMDATPANYEAAIWKTWLADNKKQIDIGPPVAAAQLKAELKAIKQRINALDEKTITNIRYWNAGAPSYRWNQILPGLIAQKQELQLRMPGSWMNIAIYDATVLAWREKIKHKRKRPSQMNPSIIPVVPVPVTYSFPCEHTVTAAAAATVLAYFFPEKKDSVLQMARSASQSRLNAGLQFASDIEAGWKLGEEVGKQVIEKAKNDGSTTVWNGVMNKDPKKWTGAYPLGITLTNFTPLVLRSADQFRPAPPPDFENDMKELKSFKQTFKTKALAFYWASTGETWTELAGKKMFEYGMHNDAPKVALVYATLTSAYHDVAIGIMDAKYTYWGIRPDQYDTTYKPLIGTPPFPGYPSGHAAGAGSSCAVMQYFFPADAKEFQKLAQDCADSRFYAGIHFRTDNEVGLKMGKDIGNYIVESWMKNTGAHLAADVAKQKKFGSQ